MADIIYTVNQDSPDSIAGFEQYSQEDRALVSSFQINNVFNPTKNYAELHILSLSDELIESAYDYNGYKQSIDAQSAGQEGTSALTIDPIEDSKAYGYGNGGVKLLYHFLDDLYSQDKSKVEFYIQDISADRTEVSLATLSIPSEDLVTITSLLKNNLQSQSYFTGFRLNFKNNDLFIATNIDTLDSPTGKVVVVKLYEPLPETYTLKNTLNIVDVVSDSVAYEIDAEFIIPPVLSPTLRSPNFNIDITDHSVVPTGYLNYNELFSYPINNSNSQIFSTVNEKSIDINVDYTDFSDFVHFSSAQERLLNFKYKVDLITSYSASLSTIATTTTGLQGVSGSREYYQNLLTGVVSNFDHYERFLYYESGSSSWPKSNTTKPYINKAGNTSEAITWYANQIANAIDFDNTNYSSLAYSIPTFLRDDANNENYLTFVYMVGQHFDNLWLYSKAVTDKYDADNRIDHGISKDLVAEALKNFGVKLYTSNKSVEDLFTTFIGQAYQSGSEKINVYVTGSLTGSNASIQPTSYDDYQKEVQKRIYHNLPLLLKSKGTERGLRALINCLGIPGDILDIKLYGGRNINERPFYGDYQNYTGSLSKIRLDNTGSLISGSTLSNSVSIIKRDDKYTDDLHVIEVGFSPTDNIDNYIISRSLATSSLSSFNIDNYIGDPNNLYLDNYSGLESIATTILSGSLGTSGSYDLRDYVRLIKFYDNTIFKMVKDFIPARAVADTGIVIKPNLLNRSKAKSVIVTGSRPEYSGSIDTAFISGRSVNTFKNANTEKTTQYYDHPQTPTGIGTTTPHYQGEATYNGEVSGSFITVSNTDLNSANPYKVKEYTTQTFPVVFVSSSNEVCLLGTAPTPFYITSSQALWYPNQFFTFTNTNCIYSASSTVLSPIWTPITTWPRTFGPSTSTNGYFQDFLIKATNRNVIVPSPGSCTTNLQVRFATCSMNFNIAAVDNVQQWVTGKPTVNLTSWVNNPNGQILQYTASYSTSSTVDPIPLTTAQAYKFDQAESTYVTITVRDQNIGDICNMSRKVYVGACNLFKKPYISTETTQGFTFMFSTYDGINTGVDEFGNQLPTQFAGAKLRTIGTKLGFPLNNAARYQGIQGYFTPLTPADLTQNPLMRYNIFRLMNPTGVVDSNKYRLEVVARGIDPRTPPDTWAGGGLVGAEGLFYPTDYVEYFNTGVSTTTNYADPALYGTNRAYYPIVLNAPFSQTTNHQFIQDGELLPIESLPRAYVVQAYKQNQATSCMQQIVIYGDHATLKTAEGVISSINPHFITKQILVGWDYTTFPAGPLAPYPTIPTGGDFGPWVDIKVREYKTTAQVPCIGPPS